MMLDKFIEKCSSKRVYIYGDGADGRLVRIFLYEQNIDVEGFVVTAEPNRRQLMDLPVKSLFELTENDKDALFLICMNKSWWLQVVNNLEEKGCSNILVLDSRLRKNVLEQVQFSHIFEDVEIGRYINTLLYHRIESLETVSSLVVTEQNFEDQLCYIKENFEVLKADESWNGVNKKSVVLTFDDGYVDFYRNAYPLLKKYNIPATVFVATGNIGNTREFWWDRLERCIFEGNPPSRFTICDKRYAIPDFADREALMDEIHDQVIVMHCEDREAAVDELAEKFHVEREVRERYRTMNAEEIKELSKDPLITIGAHTVSHILCDCESAAFQKKEIEESKLVLEKITGKEVNLFAYPNGNIGQDTRAILEELGFIRAFTCVNACIGNDDKKFDIPRCPVLNWPAETNVKWFRGMWQTGKDV